MVGRSLALVTVLLVLAGGCAKQPPASSAPPPPESTPESIRLTPQEVPAGYIVVAAQQAGWVLLQTDKTPDGQEKLLWHEQSGKDREVAARPYNHMFSWATDGPWVVWVESQEDAGRSQNDQWSIWAWDVRTGSSQRIASAMATASEMGLTQRGDIGPDVFVAGNEVLWRAWERTSDEATKRLHLYDLQRKTDRVLAAGSVGLYHMLAGRVAYAWNQTIVLQEGDNKRTIAESVQPQALVVTRDAVAWLTGGALHLSSGSGTREIPMPGETWAYTAADHFVGWANTDRGPLHLVRTRDGVEVVADVQASQNAQVMGPYVTWRDPQRQRVSYIAKLP